MKEILEFLKNQPKDNLLYLIYELMLANKFSFEDLAMLHVKNLERLRKGESEKLMQLRGKVISIWTDSKKNVGKNLISIMQEAKDNGWANISQEQIDNSKWNKQEGSNIKNIK